MSQDDDPVRSVSGGAGFPQVFGPYLLLAPLGRGGMGEVFLAKSSGIAGIEKHHVLKKVRPSAGASEAVNRFLDEARVVVHLAHKNVCHVSDAGRVGDEYYLAMEYIAGLDLRGLVVTLAERGRRLEPTMALFVLSEMLEALDYAHRLKDPSSRSPLKLVHRDVSPQNVMVSWEGEVKLIDFGLAFSSLKRERTESGVVMGKLAYMAPEQARGEAPSAASDQYAAAVVGYELMTGDRFWGDLDMRAIWARVGRGGHVPPRWGELSEQARAVLGRALSPRAEERFETCGEMRDALLKLPAAAGVASAGAALRRLLHEACAVEIDHSERVLAESAKLGIASLRPPATAPRSSEPTASFSILSAPADEWNESTELAEEQLPSGRDEEWSQSTEVVGQPLPATLQGRAEPPRRRLAWAAGLGIAGVAVALAFAFLPEEESPTAVLPETNAPDADREAPTPATPDDARDVAPPPGANKPRAVEESNEPAAVAPSESPPKRRRPAVRQRRRASAERSPPLPPAPSRDAVPLAKLLFLKKNCSRLPCTRTVTGLMRTLQPAEYDAKLDPPVERCLRKCGASR